MTTFSLFCLWHLKSSLLLTRHGHFVLKGIEIVLHSVQLYLLCAIVNMLARSSCCNLHFYVCNFNLFFSVFSYIHHLGCSRHIEQLRCYFSSQWLLPTSVTPPPSPRNQGASCHQKEDIWGRVGLSSDDKWRGPRRRSPHESSLKITHSRIYYPEPGVVAHACDLNTQEAEAE
jgi:hypothetical protein